jgi:glycosyltransferase involved in cell wall biosynthesis
VKTKVLFAIPELDRGGPDRVLFELMSRLDRTRFAPSLMVNKPEGYYLKRLSRDVPVRVLGEERRRRDRYPVLRALREVRREAPDIVFATLRMNITLGVCSPAFPRKTRLILRQANDVSADFDSLIKRAPLKHRVSRQVLRMVLRRASAVVCQSEAMRRDVESVLGSGRTLHVIANPIDVRRAAALAADGNASLRGKPALISVARLMPQKGYDLLLHAIDRVRRTYPSLHLTIVGDGPDKDMLEGLIHSLALTEHVKLAGYSHNPLPLVRAADIFVLGSRWEGLPNAALEALACGTPIVLTDCPGANATVVNEINGRLATVTAEGIADALESAIRALPSFDRTAIAADCERRYASERIVTQYEALFDSVALAGPT